MCPKCKRLMSRALKSNFFVQAMEGSLVVTEILFENGVARAQDILTTSDTGPCGTLAGDNVSFAWLILIMHPVRICFFSVVDAKLGSKMLRKDQHEDYGTPNI